MLSHPVASEQTQAITKIQKAYRAYLIRKQWPVLIPPELYSARDKFLTSRLTKDDVFYKSLAGTPTFVATLNAGNYQLLTHYLQQGKDPRKFLYDAYFCQQSISVDLLDTIADVKHAADELTQSKRPGNQVQIFPLIHNNTISTATTNILLPFLKKIYPLKKSDVTVMMDQFLTIPNGENFFATIDIHEKLRLSALKFALKRALTNIHENNYAGVKATIFKHQELFRFPHNPAAKLLSKIANSVMMLNQELLSKYAINQLQRPLEKAYSNLKKVHPWLRETNIDSNFYFQLINVNVTICSHISSPNGGAISQVIIPTKIMEICHELVYGKMNLVKRLTGFGIFTPQCIGNATQSHSRLINACSKNVTFMNSAHEARAGAWTLRVHDIEHWIRMNAIPIEVRGGITELSYLLSHVTHYPYAKLSYAFYDMDIAAFEYLHFAEPLKTNIVNNMLKIHLFYNSVIKGYRDLRPQLMDYHLVLIYGLLKDPAWMSRTFSHCTSSNPKKYLDYFLMKLGEPFGLESIHYEDMKKFFNPNKSTTDNVFYYLMWEALVKNKLSLPVLEIFNKHILPYSNIYQWQRNNGLKINVGSISFLAREITDANAIQLFNMLLKTKDSPITDRLRDGIQHTINSHKIKTPAENTLIIELKNLVPTPNSISRTALTIYRFFSHGLVPKPNDNANTHLATPNP